MNKLINDFNRGFSLKNDDLRFIDEAVRTALADLAKAIGGSTPRVLWGCAVTQSAGALVIAEGAIYWNNEIWHVYAHNVAATTPVTVPVYWVFIAENDAAGTKLDADLASHNAYQVRKAVASLTNNPAGTIGYMLVQASAPVVTDTTNPSPPTSLAANRYLDTYALTWTAASDNVAVLGYQIYVRIGTGTDQPYAVTSNTSYSVPIADLSVSEGDQIAFRVKAYDAAGNYSEFSSAATVTYVI